MKVTSLFRYALLLGLSIGCFSGLGARDAPFGTGALPVAIYKNIKIDDLKKSLLNAFGASHFLLVSTTEDKDNLVAYRFSYPIPDEEKPLVIRIKIDGTLDKKNACAPCFFRLGYVEDSMRFISLPWLTTYALNRSLYPDLDRAYLTFLDKTASYADRKSINYHPLRDGASNGPASSNAYVRISLADLKQGITRAMEEAGFVAVSVDRSKPPSRTDTLRFIYPYAPGQTAGAAYALGFYNQWDAEGNCFPCEVMENYNPYQPLPAAGLTGMLDRATLPSRFEAALAQARDKVQMATERYLRPGAEYFRPKITSPLGTPRPYMPPVTT